MFLADFFLLLFQWHCVHVLQHTSMCIIIIIIIIFIIILLIQQDFDHLIHYVRFFFVHICALVHTAFTCCFSSLDDAYISALNFNEDNNR